MSDQETNINLSLSYHAIQYGCGQALTDIKSCWTWSTSTAVRCFFPFEMDALCSCSTYVKFRVTKVFIPKEVSQNHLSLQSLALYH